MIYKFLKEKAVFMIILIIVASVAFSVSLKSVSASTSRVCCERTKTSSEYHGDSCVYTLESNCDANYDIENVACEYTDKCKAGCCVKNDECEINTLKGSCLAENGIWKDSVSCDIEQCKKGCCTLSNTNAVFTTQDNCRALVEPYENINFNEAFDTSITTEAECILKARGQEQGCCLKQDKCEFATRANCQGSDFVEGTLCSYEPLGCECTEKHHTGCRTGFEEVYWFDSCGNVENIYGTPYRQDGKVVSKEESCNINDANIENINCGNCEYSKSSICSEASDSFLNKITNSNLPALLKPRINHMCTDLRCYDTKVNENVPWMKGQTRENGEAWCEYEGATGLGRDLVGSRQILHKCINGKEIIEPCQEERKEICVQGEIPESFPEIGGQTSASCKVNNWQTCLGQNDQDGDCELNYTITENDVDLCSGECDAYTSTITFGNFNRQTRKSVKDGYEDEWKDCCKKQLCRKEACNAELVSAGCYWNDYFDICLPGVPAGWLNADANIGSMSAQDICDFGDLTCTELWEKPGTGSGWRCIKNCDCHEKVYGTEANQLCRSLGDCGSQYNVEGVLGRSGFSITDNAPKSRRSWIFGGRETFGHNNEGYDIERFSALRNVDNPLNGSIFLMSEIVEKLVGYINPGDLYDFNLIERLDAQLWTLAGTFGASITFLVISDILGLNMAFDLISFGVATLWQGSAATFVSTVAIDGGTAPISGTLANFLATGIFEAIAAVTMIVSIGLALFTLGEWLLSLGHETAQLTYWYDCDPWVAPDGGKDCEKCNSYTVCDEYKCNSLGRGCVLLNKGKNDLEVCTWKNPNDNLPPIIKPLLITPMTENDIIKTPVSSGSNGGYEFKNTIEAYKNVKIGIKTVDENDGEELAICKISRIAGLPFESEENEMQYYFSDYSNPGDKVNHTMNIPFLTPGTELEDGEDKIVLVPGKTNTFYVKCKDTNGNVNLKDYFIKIKVGNEPDIRPLKIEGYSLINGAKLPGNINKTSLTLYLNEMANSVNGGCKWSRTNGITYENMVNNFTCSEDLVNRQYYACTGTLTNLTKGDNVFYFRCKDAAGNVNDADQPEDGFHLILTDGLNISESGPEGDVYASGVNMTVTTIDGADDGNADCYYSLTNYFSVNSLRFGLTGESEHVQEFTSLTAGEHKFYVWCEDSVGNDATTLIKFNIKVDNTAPKLLRIWTESSQLKIKVNEEAACRYSNEDLSFNFGTGIAMVASDNNLIHSASYEEDKVYYIKCRDFWSTPNEVKFTVYP